MRLGSPGLLFCAALALLGLGCADGAGADSEPGEPEPEEAELELGPLPFPACESDDASAPDGWHLLPFGFPSGLEQIIADQEDPRLVYALMRSDGLQHAAAPGGAQVWFFRSTDGGRTFCPASMPPERDSIVSGAGHVLYSTGYGPATAAFRSTDGGTTWIPFEIPFEGTWFPHESTANLLMGWTADGTLFESDDGGVKWSSGTTTAPVEEDAFWTSDVLVDGSNPDNLWLFQMVRDGYIGHHSTNHGVTWAEVPGPSLEVNEPNIVLDSKGVPHCFSYDADGLHSWRYSDGAWELRGAPVRLDLPRLRLAQGWQSGDFWMSTDQGLLRTDDGGKTWSMTEYPSAGGSSGYQNCCTIAMRGAGDVFLLRAPTGLLELERDDSWSLLRPDWTAYEGALLMTVDEPDRVRFSGGAQLGTSEDGGETWSWSPSPETIVHAAAAEEGRVYANIDNLRDNFPMLEWGGLFRFDEPDEWVEITPPDFASLGPTVDIRTVPGSPDLVYVLTEGALIFSENSGASFETTISVETLSLSSNGRLAVDPSDPSRVVVAGGTDSDVTTIWTFSDYGKTVETESILDVDITNAEVSQLLVGTGDPPGIFAATAKGLFKSIDDGLTFDDIGAGVTGLEGNRVYAVTQAAGAPDTFVAVTAQRVFVTADGGEIWRDIDGPSGISGLPIDLFVDPRDVSHLYLLTSAGLLEYVP